MLLCTNELGLGASRRRSMRSSPHWRTVKEFSPFRSDTTQAALPLKRARTQGCRRAVTLGLPYWQHARVHYGVRIADSSIPNATSPRARGYTRMSASFRNYLIPIGFVRPLYPALVPCRFVFAR